MSRWLPSLALVFLAILGVWGIQQMTTKTQPAVSFPAVDTETIKNDTSNMLGQGEAMANEQADTLGTKVDDLTDKTKAMGANAMDKAGELKDKTKAMGANAMDKAGELKDKTQAVGVNALDKAGELKDKAVEGLNNMADKSIAPVENAREKAANLAQKGVNLVKGESNPKQKASLQPNLGDNWTVSPVANSSNTFKAVNNNSKQQLTATVTLQGNMKHTVLTDANGKTVNSFNSPLK